MTKLAPLQSESLAKLDGAHHAFYTRRGGVSEGIYDSLNCGLGSGDARDAVIENRRRAIGCYEAALRVYTEAAFPQDWAMTQNNLGIAYQNLPDGDRDRKRGGSGKRPRFLRRRFSAAQVWS